MPAVIQVSVLEFLPPQSSSPLSEVSLKISLGKREYQILEMGDFSFPLINLRDNLIIALQNAEGIVISHSVIETKLVIEKGIWDDLFAFEGGGHVHMKLQFVLSEEDRHRIRIMRLSALKRKHDELLKGEDRSPKQPAMVHSYSASSFQTDKEVSDSQKSPLRNEVIQDILPSTTATSTPFKTRNSKKETNPNDTDRYKDAQPNSVKEASSSGSLGPVLAEKPEAHKENLVERNPSKIRSTISAFESSLNQDMRPKTKPLVTESVQPTDNSKESTSGTDRSEGTASNLENKVGMEIPEEKTSAALTEDKTVISERLLIERPKRRSNTLSPSSENSRKQRNGEEILTDSSHMETNSTRASANVENSLESHGAWIFPDGGKSPCLTVGGEKIIFFLTEAREENPKEVQEDSELRTGDSIDAQSSKRPFRKVVRALITVGFAALVFFTR